MLPATLTWTGAFDANWNDGTIGVSTNWSGNVLPASGDTLIFAAGAAHLTNVNNTTANNAYTLQFTGGAFVISGNAIDLAGAGISDSSTSAVSVANSFLLTGPLTVNVSGTAPLTLSGVLSQSAAGTGLTETGGGTLTLSNSANTFSGAVNIQQGTLQAAVLANSGTVSSLGTGSGTATITLGSTSAATLSYTGATASTNRAITVGGAGGGTIQATSAAATLTLSGGINNAGNLVTFATSSGNIAESGVISGAGGLTETGAGILTLSNTANTFTGVTTVSSGTLSAASLANAGINSSLGAPTAGNAVITLGSAAAATLSYTGGSVSTNFAITIGGAGGGTVQAATAGATLTLTGGVATAGNTVTFADNPGNITIASVGISGAGNVTNTGTGTLTLNVANSYSGVTTISAGTIADGVANGVPIGTALAVAGTLDLAGFAQTVASVTGGGTVTDSGAAQTFTINNGSADTFAGSLAGSLALTKTATGNLTLSYVNSSFTGGTTISAGTVTVAALANAGVNSSLGAPTVGNATITLGSATVATLAYNGATTSTNLAVTIGGAGGGTIQAVTAGATLTLNGGINTAGNLLTLANNTGNIAIATTPISGAGKLKTTGAGTLFLDVANTYTGTTTITSGSTVSEGTANALPVTTTLSVPGTLDLAGFAQTVALVSGSGTVTDSGASAVFTVNNATNKTFAGVLSGSLALTKTGAGTLTLSKTTNSYTGPTTISAGILTVAALANAGTASSLGAPTGGNATITLGSATAATLSYNGTTAMSTNRAITIGGAGGGTIQGTKAVATLTLTGGIANAGNPVTLAANTAAIVVSTTAITGSGGLTKTGTGILTLNVANTYGGATTINAGTVTEGVTNALPTTTALTVTGTLDLAGFAQTIGSVTGAGTVTDSGAAQTFAINNASSDAFAGLLSGSLALTKTAGGTLTLSNAANSYTGATTINTGTVSVAVLANAAVNSSLGAPASANATITLGSASTALLSYTGATATTNRAITIGGAGGGIIQATSAATTLTLSGGIATAGNLVTFDANSGNIVVSTNAISGAGGSLTKTGAGTLQLTAAETYTGATTVNAGNLLVAAGLSASSAVAVNGGTISGAGPVGAVTSAGGTVLPGNGTPGTFTTGSLTLDAASTYTVDLNGTTVGTSYSQLVMSGTASLGAADLNIVRGYTPIVGQQFDILRNTGGNLIGGTFTSPAGTPLPEGTIFAAQGMFLQITYVGGASNQDVVLTVISIGGSYPLLLVNNGLTLNENTTATLTSNNLQAGAGNPPASVVFTVVTAPGHGSLKLSGVSLSAGGTFTQNDINSGNVTYVNNGASAGYTDSFTFSVSNGASGTVPTTTFAITVIDAITLVNHGRSLNKGTTASLTSGQLQATAVESASALVYTLVTAPTYGALENSGTVLTSGSTFTQADINAGNMTYADNGTSPGNDSFTFSVSDSGGGTVPTTTFAITINDPITLTNAGLTVVKQTITPLTSSQLSAVADDPASSLVYTLAAVPTSGTIQLNGADLSANDQFTQNDINTGLVAYNNTSAAAGTDSFTFTISDGDGGTVPTTTFAFTVSDPVPVANSQSFGTNEDTALPLTLTAADSAGDAMTYSIVVNPSHGALVNTGNGTYNYTPANGYYGPDSFTFTASNATVTSSSATVAINVVDNSVVTATPQSLATNEDTALPLTVAGADSDGNPLTYAIAVGPTHGTLTPTGNGSYIYTPANGFHAADSFTFTATDGTITSTPATVSINVVDNSVVTATPQSLSTNEDTALPLTLAGTDSDGNPLTYAIAVGPTHGTLTPTGNGGYTYTPANGFHAADSFTFTATDGTITSTPATVSISVVDNSVVTATPQSLTTNEDTALPLTLVGTDSDGNSLTYAIAVGPTHGTLTPTGNGGYTYTPANGFHAADSFTFTATDGTITSTPATVAINVVDNSVVTATPQSLSTNEDTALPLTLAGTDSDSNPLTYAIAVSPTNGTLTPTGNGSYTYTPANGFHAADSFTFTATDGTITSTPATVSINVVDNSVVTATPQSLTTNEDTALPLTLAGTDSDGNPLTYAIAVGPTNGALTPTGNGSYTYTPANGFHAADSFTFTATDGTITSTPATVAINVVDNSVVTATPQSLATNEDTALPLTLAGTDSDGNPLTYTIAVGPTHGTLTPTGNGSYTYTPANGFHAADSFTFTATDGTITSMPATVSINVVDNSVVTATPQSLSTNEDTALPLTLAGTDSDGNPLTYAIAVGPTHGTLTPTGNGGYTYTPANGFHAADSFTFTATDGTITSTPATVSISVVDNSVVTATPQSLATNEDTALPLTLAGTDSDGNPLTYAIVVGPTHGTLTPTGNGSYTYTPANGFHAADSFTFTATDGTIISTPATVAINVVDNSVVTATPQSLSTNEDTALPLTLAGADSDGNPLTYAIAVGPANGTLTLTGNGSYTYTPANGFHAADSFTFTATDGTITSSPATVSINVVDNSVVTVTPQSLSTNEDTALPLTLAGTNSDGNPLTYAIAAGSTHGTLTPTGNGGYTYTPANGFHAADSFTFTATDGTITSTPATVSINVVDNSVVTATPQSLTTNEDTALLLTLAGADSDGNPLTYAVAVGPTHGTLTPTGNGGYTYTPTNNYHGSDSFTFTATDGTNTSAPATVGLTVVDTVTPVANAQSLSTNPSMATSGTLTAADSNNDALTFAIVGNPAHGTLTSFNAATGAFTYTPTANFQGTDSFTFTASDGTNTSAAATVSITISGAGIINLPTNGVGDNYTLKLVGPTLELLNGAMNVIDARPFSTVTSYTVNGVAGQHDTLTVDFSGSGGNPIPAGGVTFNGGSGGNDSLTVSGAASFSTLNYTAAGVGAAALVLNGTSTINVTGLQPITVIPTVGAATVNISDGLAHVATFTAGAAAGANTVSIDGGLGCLTFADPTVALVVNSGPGPGSDTFNFASLDSAFNAALTVNALTGPTDMVNLNTALTLGSSTSAGTVCINADIININQPINTAAVSAGSINLTAAMIDLGANLNTNGGNVNLTGGSVVLTASPTIATEQGGVSAAGNVTFTGTLSATAAADNLTIDAGLTSSARGNVAFAALNSAAGSLVNQVSIVDANNVTFNSTIMIAGSLSQSTGAGTTTLNGGSLGALTLNTAGIVLNGSLSVTGASTLTVTGTGAINGTIASGSSNITLNGAAFTFAGANRFSSANNGVTLGNNTTLTFGNNSQTFGSLASAGNATVQMGSGTLTTGSVTSIYNGVLTGTGGLTKAGTGNFTLTGLNTYAGITTISGGSLTINGTLSTASASVTLSTANVTLNGIGYVNRPVVVNGANDTIGSGAIGGNVAAVGLTITTNAGVGITVNSAGSAAILGNTIPTGPGGKNAIAIEINGGKALIQDNTLNTSGLQSGNFTATSLPTTSSPYYGIVALAGGIVDAGQISGNASLTGLGISAGRNSLTGYQNYTGTALPASLSKAVAQAILDENTNSPNNAAGPQGLPFDLYAQNDNFGGGNGKTSVTSAGNVTNGGAPGNYSAIEQVVFGDTDASTYGFVNYVTPTAMPQLITTQFYSVSASELTTNPDQRSMIRRIDVAFNTYVKITPGAFSITMEGAAALYATSWSKGSTVAMTATQVLFDPTTGQFRYEYGFATGQSGVESSGSLTDGEYQFGYNTGLIVGNNGMNPTVGTGASPYQNPNSFLGTTPGSSQGNYAGSGSNYTLNFHRLFGDMDGMGDIDSYDMSAMAAALGQLSGRAAYNADLDYNNDGSIDNTTDNPQFTKRKSYYTGVSVSLYIGYGWDV